MAVENMKTEILRFCEMYSGRAIGEETRYRLENLSIGDDDGIRDIYEELEADGWL